MDGHFVPNITFGPQIVEYIRKKSKLVFDVHLMIEDPDKYIPDFAKAGADIISVHAETCTHLHRTIQNIKSFGVKPAVALNPSTPLNCLEYIIEDIDMVLLMTVNPGFGGQQFIEKSITKISIINNIKDVIDNILFCNTTSNNFNLGYKLLCLITKNIIIPY
jgi:ribulose-phosphate 3-epimerase